MHPHECSATICVACVTTGMKKAALMGRLVARGTRPALRSYINRLPLSC
jgi:hypothetical protein